MRYAGLNDVAAVSSNDVWTVGVSAKNNILTQAQAFIEHWDGTRWSVVSSPNGNAQSGLQGIVALSHSDIWAVGGAGPEGEEFGTQTLIEHWDGVHWSIVSSPNPGSSKNGLFMIAGNAPDDLWIAGVFSNSDLNHRQTFSLHWNGVEWKMVALPQAGADNILYTIAFDASDDVCAAGTIGNDQQTLFECWNGTSWKIISSINPGPALNRFFGIAHIPGTDQFWMVGDYQDSTNTFLALTEVYS